MSDVRTILDKLYAKEPEAQALEKTAEAQLFQDLQGQGDVVEENPYSDMSMEDLLKIASDMNTEDVSEDVEEEVPELIEKTAADMLGGQIMAHSMIHEFGLIKEAMADGNCRVCKTSPLDAEGSSVCIACLSDGEQAA